MLYAVIKKNSYQDSVSLMLLSASLAKLPGVTRFTAMMGTDPNKDIMRNTGLYAPELDGATASDICIVVDAAGEEARDAALAAVEEKLAQKAQSAGTKDLAEARTWDGALKALPGANLALFSIPGIYVASEVKKALDKGLNAFIFSDNVPVEAERELKVAAREKGLMVMGPDCGTGIIGGVPLAFANKVARGSIGVAAASGTGLQEITTLIDKMGEGVSAAIGTGGRDLSESVGGVTMLSALDVLAADMDTEVVVVASKPPAKSVRDAIIRRLREIPKPVVAVFMGEGPGAPDGGNIRYAHTLSDAAKKAVALARSGGEMPRLRPNGAAALKGLYSGGTLASEAAMLLSEAFGEKGAKSEEILWKLGNNEIIDLGEDCYTRGRPHPMIDPSLRLAMLREKALLPETAVLLFDVVLGYGAHPDMGGVLAEAIEELRPELASAGKDVFFVAALCGTPKDPQGYDKQLAALARAGVTVRESNTEAVAAAAKRLASLQGGSATAATVGPLFSRGPAVVNVGLRGFAEDLAANACPVVHYEWKPVAGGDERLAKLLEGLE